MENPKKNIIKCFQSMQGKYSIHGIFCDWVTMCALSICNSVHITHDSIWQGREDEYLAIAKKYTKEELDHFAEMMAWLCEALEQDLTDVLGEAFEELGAENKQIGQFFTPFSVSEMTARQINNADNLPKSGPIRISEPSCGAGGMCIAVIKVVREIIPDWQRRLEFTCQDIDWRSIYMAYLQLSLLGVKATIAQGDTLVEPYHLNYPKYRVFHTPASMGTLF